MDKTRAQKRPDTFAEQMREFRASLPELERRYIEACDRIQEMRKDLHTKSSLC